MLFLLTEHGELIAGKHIISIGPQNSRPKFNRYWHEIEYQVGRDTRTVTASAEAVQDFLLQNS
jgi:hypothetical protein